MAEPMDRHARQDARAKEVIERERAHQEKRKNSLPPFLMVRSGLLNMWLLTLLIAIGAGVSVVKNNGNIFGETNMVPIMWLACLVPSIGLGIYGTHKIKSGMIDDTKRIRDEFGLYIDNDKYTLDFSDYVQNKKLMCILIDHIMKYDDGTIIDKIKENPNSVPDLYVLNTILKSYLRRHSENAQIIRDKIPEDKMYDTVRRIIDKQTKRLANCEQCR